MTSYRVCFLFVVLATQTCVVFGQEEITKSSLTFVIDDTGSMYGEIAQVKDEVNIIFEKVLSSSASQIENFVLVTFNDPDAALLTITKDRNEFKRALASINVHGGGDCPEYAMKGIEIGLKQSLPQSYIYVFTDASAYDHTRFEEIKSLAQKKQSQIVFLLTGECGSTDDTDYLVYNKIAEATSGQVFHMEKDDVKVVLKYIEETITGRSITLVNKKIPPGSEKIKYPVPPRSGDVLITVTGTEAKIGEVTGPGGSKPKTEPVISGKEEMASVKVIAPEAGDHEVEVGSKSGAHAVITAKTSFNVQLGFSVLRPTSMKDTVTKPAPEGNGFLGVKLQGDGVKLTKAKILDMSDNVITELPLELVDETSKFYVTPSFSPPNTIFRVSAEGYDVESKLPISITGPTPIERQNPRTEKAENTAPQITIDGSPLITTEYDEPLQLKCRVHAYPKPDIIWEEKDSGTKIPATVQLVEVPYDYVSILDVEKSNKNITYQCRASNSIGVNIKFVEVQTKRKLHLDVLEAPKDIHIDYKKEGQITCKVDAYPPASISWYKDGKDVSGNPHIQVSSDKSILTIKDMQPNLEGTYMCEAINDVDRKVFYSEVTISGVESPVIDKSHTEVRTAEKTDAVLTCRILKGIPKPTVRWVFRQASTDRIIRLKDTTETLVLKNVGKHQSGTYKCVAKNIMGLDRVSVEFVVEYKPKIEEDDKNTLIKEGEDLTLPCKVSGEPYPTVKWYFNGTRIENATLTGDYSLKLKATLDDSGSYTCEAENKLGQAKKHVSVQVFIPVTIHEPKEKKIEMMVGKSAMLQCLADGHPKPTIKWYFNSSDSKTPEKHVTVSDVVPSLPLKNAQLDQQGSYTCVAENIGGSANLTYEVNVFAPPIIENEYPTKTFEALEGDLTLRIACKATGSPKPTIVWTKNGLNLAFGTEWYEMEEDGTLIIKNIDHSAEGTYVCIAENRFGNDTEFYEVKVKDPSVLEIPTKTMLIEEGKPADITCDLPHTATDKIRWFKNGRPIESEELHIVNITRSDDGLYTCRVSDFVKSRSFTTKVVVGFKPIFATEEKEEVQFILNADPEFLSCQAYGEPRPKDTIWKHDGKVTNVTDMSYPLGMVFGATGIYECEVSNDFGTIRRTFKVTSRDCILDLKKDFPEKHPLMYSSSLSWPAFQVTEGFMIIPKAEYFYFNCPEKFANFPSGAHVMAFCERDNQIKIRGINYNFEDLKCNEEVKPDIMETGFECLPGNTQYIQIGFRVHNEFLKVYEVCYDNDKNEPLFAKHKLSPDHTDSSIESEWFNDILPHDFDSMYDCARQAYDISLALPGVRSDGSCCYGKRQLVNSKNLQPGVPASASFNYLNVVPQWSTCNSKNWDDLEDRVRNLVKKAGRDLSISTGIANPYPDAPPYVFPILKDGYGVSQAVSPFLWKVVQDPATGESLAIIQVNFPLLDREDASRHILCPDICENIDWLRGTNWQNVEDGFTYCCAITEFEKAFGFIDLFSPDMNRVLFSTSLIPETYLTKK
nr:hemicentin-2-like [Helicoverpa armigera]